MGCAASPPRIPFLALHISPVQEPYTVHRYLLARHVFVCLHGEHAVLLDLRCDQYLALDAATADRLTEMVVDWPAQPARPPGQLLAHSAESMEMAIEELVQRGLLTTDLLQGKSAIPVTAPQPLRALMAASEVRANAIPVPPFLQAARTAALLVASGTAALWLRCFPIHRTVGRVASAGRLAAIERHRFNETTAHQGVSLFYQLRPFLFSARNACLFDSLTLLLFLRRLRLFPQWIFGVRTGPFAAHCWLQHEHTVLNDTVDNVRSYTPIMLV